MVMEDAWPPKSPRAALLSSPSGRKKYLSYEPRTRRSPTKQPATSPGLLDRLRAARANNDYLEPNEPSQEDTEDEETLKLQLAAIEARLKLKKLQQNKIKSDIAQPASQPSSSLPASAAKATNDVLVSLSPSKKTGSDEQRSPKRVLLGIDKGLKGSDVSLKRARSAIDRSRSRQDFSSRPTSRLSGLSSQRSTASAATANSVSSFSERMNATREAERAREAQRHTTALNRSKSFKIDRNEVENYRQAAVNQPEASRSPVRPGSQQIYSRQDILKAKESEVPESGRASKSVSRPASRADPSPNSNCLEADASLYENFSGLHLSSRILPHSFLKRTLPDDQFTVYRIPDLLREVKSPEYELPSAVADYVVFGVVASKSIPRDHKQKVEEKSVGSNDWERKWEDGSSNSRKFIVMTLCDLDWSLDLYLFGTAVPRYHRLTPGTVIAILNPNIMPPRKGKEDTGAFSLTLHDGDDTVLEIGTAKHLGYCNALRKDGKECGQWVNATKTEICEFHLNIQLAKTQAGRMGVNTGSNGGTKLNSNAFTHDSRLKGSREGEGRLQSFRQNKGEKYSFETQSSYFISKSHPSRAQNGPGSSKLDLDDPFIAEGHLSGSRDRKTLLKMRKERLAREEDIAKQLSTFDPGGAGSEYLRLRTRTATPGAGQSSEGASQRSALATKANIMRSRSDAGTSRKRAAESVRLSPVKKTRFLTEKGIRVAGRESLGVTNVDDDDDLDIV